MNFLSINPILTGEQIITLSLVVWAVIQILSIIWCGLLKKPKPEKGIMRVIVFVIALPFAYFWSGVAIPVPGDNPVVFAVALVTAAGEILIFSGLIYDYILKGVFEWIDTTVLRRSDPLLAP